MKNLLIIVVCLFCGCAVADLRLGRPSGEFSTVDLNKGRDILKEVASHGGYIPENNYIRLDVTLVDHWNSPAIRWLTPVRSDNQKLQFTIGLKDIDVLMTYLDGPGLGDTVGIKNDKTFKTIKGQTFNKNYQDVKIYCM